MNDPAPEAGAPVLAAEALARSYRTGPETLHVLRHADLTVAEGEWVAVRGASGSGKSTLLHLLGALDRPTSGRVRCAGEDVFRLRGAALDRLRCRRVGFVFQFYHLLPELSALQNAMLPALVDTGVFAWPRRRAAVRQRAEALLERLSVAERRTHRPNRLSGGERQRVAIARALINQPAVVLADEPTGNLDDRTSEQIMEVFHDLHEQGQTLIMVTHDPTVAAAAQRRFLLEDGALREEEAAQI